MSGTFRYPRRVQFAETDQAGIVHFSWMFRYMEEAEHALWRAAGMSIAEPGTGVSWPRVSAAFDFKHPLRFEDEFEVRVQLAEARTRSLRYAHTIAKGDTVIGHGTIITVCVRHDGPNLRACELPEHVVERLAAALG